MGKNFNRKLADFGYRLLKPYGLYRIHRIMTSVDRIIETGIDFKRKEPFLLIGNHQYEVDSGIYGTPWKNKPIAVVSRSLMLSPYKKFKFKFLASGIPKSQGESEVGVTRQMIRTIRNGDPLMILPEGEITYFGETLPFDNSLAKLVKMLKVDVISAVSSGGHISSPRWAYRMRKNRFVSVHFKVLLPKEEIEAKSVDEIDALLHETLYVNDYEWQRDHMIEVGGRFMAVGLEHFLYVCPECGALHSLETNKNKISCTACGNIATFNTYGFIENSKFDNLVDWNRFQREELPRLLESTFDTKGIYYHVNYEKLKSKRLGKVNITYLDKALHITGKLNLVIPITELKYFNLTQRNVITFDYQNQHYFFRIEQRNQSFKMVCLGD